LEDRDGLQVLNLGRRVGRSGVTLSFGYSEASARGSEKYGWVSFDIEAEDLNQEGDTVN
jgi:hypothetical protein